MFSPKTIAMYYVKKIFRYAPLNIFMVLFFTFIGPSLGTGPLWHGYYKTIEPCQTYWWTTMIYINNFYPQNFDDKCMPWLWYLAVYVQLSLLLPVLLLVYKKAPYGFTITLSSIIAIVMFVISFVYVYQANIGVLPLNEYDEFHSQIFMKPWYHFNSYFLGIAMCLFYKKYLSERASTEEKSNSFRLVSFFRENYTFRWITYFVGICLMLSAIFG